MPTKLDSVHGLRMTDFTQTINTEAYMYLSVDIMIASTTEPCNCVTQVAFQIFFKFTRQKTKARVVVAGLRTEIYVQGLY